jgi:hypothetical protein
MMKTWVVAVVGTMAAAKVDTHSIVAITKVDADTMPVVMNIVVTVMVVVMTVMVVVVMISAANVDAELCAGACSGPQQQRDHNNGNR